MTGFMRSAVVAAFAAGALAAPPSAAGAAPAVGCDDASIGAWDGTVGAPDRSHAFGAFRLLGSEAHARLTLVELQRLSWLKMPLVLDVGHAARIDIAPSHRAKAGWVFDHDRGGSGPLAGTAPTVDLRACPRHHREVSRLGSRRVTFWSGGLKVTRLPLCVPIRVWIDGERRARQWTLPLGRSC